jgi:hypothetical protein
MTLVSRVEDGLKRKRGIFHDVTINAIISRADVLATRLRSERISNERIEDLILRTTHMYYQSNNS